MRVSYTYYLPMRPIGKGRARATRDGRMYTPAPTRKWERDAIACILRDVYVLPQLACPVAVKIYAAFGSTREADHDTPHTARPDIDNIAKIVLDVLVKAGVITDDRWVVQVCASKRKVWIGKDRAHVAVIVEEVRDGDGV